MKQKTNIQTQAESQNRSDKHNSLTGEYKTVIQLQSKTKFSRISGIKHKTKSPPDMARSLGVIKDCKVTSCKDNRPKYKEGFYQFNQIQYSNFYHN